MCGLFGVIRHPAADPLRATNLLEELGLLAQERGTDAAGIAFATDPGARVWSPDGRSQPDCPAGQADLTCGDWRVVKSIGPLRGLQRSGRLSASDAARVVLGHTRQATQGAPDRLVNASPLVTGGVIGCHNGDIESAALRDLFALPEPTAGGTDTESLLQALSMAAGRIETMLKVLSSAIGRVALTWADHAHPGTVFLARAGLSPLAVGRDDHNNMFWASNPRWLDLAAAKVGASITRCMPLPEGTMLTLRIADASLTGHWRFSPIVRATDCAIADFAAWRHFTPADRVRDKQGLCHRVLGAVHDAQTMSPRRIHTRHTCRCRLTLGVRTGRH